MVVCANVLYRKFLVFEASILAANEAQPGPGMIKQPTVAAPSNKDLDLLSINSRKLLPGEVFSAQSLVNLVMYLGLVLFTPWASSVSIKIFYLGSVLKYFFNTFVFSVIPVIANISECLNPSVN